MRPTHLVTCALGAGMCVGAGLWMCVQGATALHVGAGYVGLIIGGALHVVCMVSAERRERAGPVAAAPAAPHPARPR